MKYGHVSFYILQIYCIRTLTKHLEKCYFNSLKTEWMGPPPLLMGPLQAAVTSLPVGFFLFIKMQMHIQYLTELLQRSTREGLLAIGVSDLHMFLLWCQSWGSLSAAYLWTCPCCVQTLDVHSFSVRAGPKYFWGFSQKIILTERTTIRSRLSSLCYHFCFCPLSGVHNTDKSLLWHSYVVFSSILLPANE